MRKFLFAIPFLIFANADLFGQPTPNYNRSLFHQSAAFHQTSKYIFFHDFNGYLENVFDASFTIEFWIKVPASVPPGTMVLRSSNFDVNFGHSDDGNGNLTPSLLFLVKSYDHETGNGFPDTDFYYHMTAEDIPYFNDWFHVAIVRNRVTYFPDGYHSDNTDAGFMRMYINGVSSTLNRAPLAELLPLDSDGFSLGEWFSSYLKIDELRIWQTARSALEIHENMNTPIPYNTGNLVAYYDFNHANPASNHFDNSADRSVLNKSRGIGSPATDDNTDEHPLAGFVYGLPNYGPNPVFGRDQEYLSVADGNWNSPDTWGGEVPCEDEIITIAHSITMNESKTQAGLVFRGPDLAMRTSASSSTERIVYTDGHTLTLLSPPTGGNEGNYIATTNGGNLVVENIPYTGATIPVGTETTYRPVGVSRPDGRFFAFSFTANDDITPSLPGSAAVVNAMWDLAPVNEGTNPSSYKITFHWNDGDESGAFSRGSAQVANYHNNQWNLLSTESIVDNYGIYSLTATASEFSPFIITSDHTSLPVRLVEFDVRLEGANAVLNWSASDAENFAGFEIERSVDADRWTILGREMASGQGRELRSYSFVDPLTNFTSSRVYYRIRMVDHDNSYSYSPIKSIGWNPTIQLGVYPNPAEKRSELRLQFPGDLHDLKITSLYGMEVYRESGPSQGAVRLPDVASGIYILSARDKNGQIYREKIIVN